MFINLIIPRQLNVKVHAYCAARNVKLASRTSSAMVLSYCCLKFQCLDVTKIQRFEIAPISGDITPGRDFLKAHAVQKDFITGDVEAKDKVGTELTKICQAKETEYQRISMRHQEIKDDGVLQPDVESAQRPIFVSVITTEA